MSFTIKIALQPFEVSFEAGSVAEAVAILEDPQNELSKLAALAAGGSDDGEGESAAAETTAAEPAKGKRGRKPKAAVEAVAPAPIPVGSEPPAPPPADTGIPPFLDRTNPAAVVAAPPPPPAPVAPPPAPPVGQLSGKVIADLKKRAEGQPDSGAALVAWLATAGLVVPGATFDEALLCIGMLDDAKLGPVATQLGVS